MRNDPQTLLAECDTLMLDMDGTVLDLAFDNFMWLQHVPERFAEARRISPERARDNLYAEFRAMQGRLEWYCLDHWSERLGLDIAGLHREQNHRVAYLPGAKAFLERVRARQLRLLLVTNSHAETLTIKNDVTGIVEHFDAVYSSHHFGMPKERREFWEALSETEDFDPERTLFIDDTETVLAGAAEFGIRGLLQIAEPDSTRPARRGERFTAIDGLRSLG